MSSKVPRLVGPKVFRQGYAVGVVVAKHHAKTIRVSVSRKLTNTKYGNTFRRSTSLKVHDELDEAALGDVVIIKQSRPHSKTKFHEVVDIAIRYPARNFLDQNPDYEDAMKAISKAYKKEE
eukprot:TRINITY_DN400_c0_g1_i2.p1 TRINITY_DN400_c0_g1~~TRINITY_DN400_c0_g1_i2.p1  ORF type:complete len:121 (+),score=31.75 TRINITY_DN400_c0_g1_i2:74-436(+)